MLDFAFLMSPMFLFGRLGGMQEILADGDTGGHIRAGEWIAAHHVVPVHDIFSYSKPDGAGYAWEWLSDSLFAWLTEHSGLATTALGKIPLISIVFSYLGDPYYSLHISEFFSLSFHHPIAISFEAILRLGAGATLWSFKRGSYTEGVLLPLFMIVAVPPVAGWLRQTARKFNAMKTAAISINPTSCRRPLMSSR
jgi:hypothetical protein